MMWAKSPQPHHTTTHTHKHQGYRKDVALSVYSLSFERPDRLEMRAGRIEADPRGSEPNDRSRFGAEVLWIITTHDSSVQRKK